MLLCELDCRVRGGMQFGVLASAALPACRVLGGMRFGVLVGAALRA